MDSSVETRSLRWPGTSITDPEDTGQIYNPPQKLRHSKRPSQASSAPQDTTVRRAGIIASSVAGYKPKRREMETSRESPFQQPEDLPEDRKGDLGDRDTDNSTQKRDVARLSKELLDSRNRIQQLEAAVKEQHEQIRDLDYTRVQQGLANSDRMSQIGSLERKLNKACREYKEVFRENKHLRELLDPLEQLQKKFDQEQTNNRRKDGELRDLRQSLGDIEKTLTSERVQQDDRIYSLKKDYDREREAVKQISRENDNIALRVKDIQEKTLNAIEPPQWMPMSAEDINRSITDITAEIKQWSKRYASSRAVEYAPTEAVLRTRGCLLGSTSALRAVLSREQSKVWTPMFLQAAVCSSAFVRIFGDPFFAFNGKGAEGAALREVDAGGLRSLMTLLEPSDLAAANGWRCQLMRMLDPIPARKASDGISLNEIAADARNRASRELAAELMKDVTGSLVEKVIADSDEPLVKLQGIFMRSAKLAWKLWTQRYRIEVLDIAGLKDVLYDNVVAPLRFEAGSEYFEHHPLHSRDVDERAAALDGREILLLVNPAITVTGLATGTNYERRKVWKKAMVWMGPAG